MKNQTHLYVLIDKCVYIFVYHITCPRKKNIVLPFTFYSINNTNNYDLGRYLIFPYKSLQSVWSRTVGV